MGNGTKRSSTLVLRLMVGLALLGWPRGGAAQGTWSVLACRGSAPGQVDYLHALAVDGRERDAAGC
jgi:hypothetical protein